MDVVAFVFSVIGIVLSLVGVSLTFVTFFSPKLVMRYALRSHEKWIELPLGEPNIKYYRHAFLSGFTIEIDRDDPIVDDFFEPWMNALHRPDKSATSYYVVLKLNGLVFLNEMFLEYDGTRNFIPLPKSRKAGSKQYLYFDEVQKALTKVVGRAYIEKSFDEFYETILTSIYNPIIINYLPNPSATELVEFKDKIRSFQKRHSTNSNRL